MSYMEIKTEKGFTCQVEENALNDMELLEELIALDGGDMRTLPSILTRLIGEDGKKRLYDHLRTETKRVPADAVTAELVSIITEIKNGKK